MRTIRGSLFALLVGALFVTCTDREPIAPIEDGPQLAAIGAEHGAWIQRFATEDMWCGFWDATGAPWGPAPCMLVHTPAPQAQFAFRIWSDDPVPNETGRAAHFGPNNPPEWLIDWYWDTFGVGRTEEGLLPLCDFNVREYPGAWTEWPFPAEVMPLLICTTNWHFTISASGKAMLVMIADPAHSWRPFAD